MNQSLYPHKAPSLVHLEQAPRLSAGKEVGPVHKPLTLLAREGEKAVPSTSRGLTSSHPSWPTSLSTPEKKFPALHLTRVTLHFGCERIMEEFKEFEAKNMQAYLEDTVCSVPDHHIETDMAVKLVP